MSNLLSWHGEGPHTRREVCAEYPARSCSVVRLGPDGPCGAIRPLHTACALPSLEPWIPIQAGVVGKRLGP
jgi:hypothetical protein